MTLLVLDYNLTLDSDIPYMDITRSYRSVFEDFTQIVYGVNGKTYYYDVSIENPSSYSEKAVIKVPREVATADRVELVLNIRNISYRIRLI